MIFLLEIDGSYGEGGGQILRNAVALSALTNTPIKIKNIRANRPNPGIKAQHYISIKSIKELCRGEVKGLEINSKDLEFIPGKFKGGKYKFDIGTAGSITLVFQTCILASLKTNEKIDIQINGGTDIKWAPSWDYFQYVFVPILQKSGFIINSRLVKRGYYPQGGGTAEITINPIQKLKPINFEKILEFKVVNGIIHIANLNENIATRMKHAAIQTLIKNNLKTQINVDRTNSLSNGTGLTLWTKSNDTILGSSFLGDRGISSEEVGKNAAIDLLKEIQAEVNLDVYAFDQILPYLVLSRANEKVSCKVREISNHAKTNMWLLQKFFNVKFEIKQNENNYDIYIS